MDDGHYSYTKQWLGRLAPVYWIFDRVVAGVRRRVVDVTNARLGSRILDVATGTGEQAFAFAQRGYEVVGVDISTDMLRIANEHDEYTNVTFRVADAANMPSEDDYFDVSCISFLHLHLFFAHFTSLFLAGYSPVDGIFAIILLTADETRMSRYRSGMFMGFGNGTLPYLKIMRSLIRHSGCMGR